MSGFPIVTRTPEGYTGLSGSSLSSASTYVYRPGGVADGNVFVTFPTLVAALALQPGPKWVEVDDSIVPIPLIPAGTFDVQGAIFQGSSQALTILRGSVGSKLTNLGGLSLGLRLENGDPASSLYDLTVGEVLNIEEGAGLGSAGATATVDWPDAGTAAIRLQNAAIVNLGGPAINVSGAGTLSILVHDGSVVAASTLATDVAGTLDIQLWDFGSTVSRTQAGVAGTISFSDILATGNGRPDVDDQYDTGSAAARWRAAWSRMSLAVEQVGAGGAVSFGPNNVGRIHGVASAALGAVAALAMVNPGDRSGSPVDVSGIALADVAGGTATVTASGAGATARGFSHAETADTALITGVGDGSLASGVTHAEDDDATIFASGSGSVASGHCHGYGTVPGYGPSIISSTGLGSLALGCALYYGTIDASGFGAQARGLATGGAFVGDNLGTLEATGNGSTAFGAAEGGTILAGSDGAFAGGRVRADAVAGPIPIIRSTGPGGLAFGSAIGPNALLEVGAGAASFVMGLAVSYANTALPSIKTGAQAGSWAGGVSSAQAGFSSEIDALDNGALAFGCAIAGTANALIEANNNGSVALGFASNNDIVSSGHGAIAAGHASANDITASGAGSMAFGQAGATGAIVASATNSIQFGPGTNGVADTMKIGLAGLHFKGTAGAFAAPANGQIWVNAGGDVYIRSGGADRNCTNIP